MVLSLEDEECHLTALVRGLFKHYKGQNSNVQLFPAGNQSQILWKKKNCNEYIKVDVHLLVTWFRLLFEFPSLLDTL